jgi:hypothetical protein
MTTPVIRGYHNYSGWSVSPVAGDFLVWIGTNNPANTQTVPTGWTVYSGLNDSVGRVLTRTANGTSTDNPNGASGNWPGLYGNGIAFSTPGTYIDYAAGTFAQEDQGPGNGWVPVSVPPKNNQTLSTSDGLHIITARRDTQGYYYDFGGGFVVYQPSDSGMNAPSGYTELNTGYYQEIIDENGYGSAWIDHYNLTCYKTLSSTTNPGSKTFTIPGYVSDTPYGLPFWQTSTIVVGVGAVGPTAYGPSIRR